MTVGIANNKVAQLLGDLETLIHNFGSLISTMEGDAQQLNQQAQGLSGYFQGPGGAAFLAAVGQYQKLVNNNLDIIQQAQSATRHYHDTVQQASSSLDGNWWATDDFITEAFGYLNLNDVLSQGQSPADAAFNRAYKDITSQWWWYLSNLDPGAAEARQQQIAWENAGMDTWAQAVYDANRVWQDLISGLTWVGRPVPSLSGITVTPATVNAVIGDLNALGGQYGVPGASPLPATPTPQTYSPTYGQDASACQGHAHCVVFMDGPNIINNDGTPNLSKTQDPLYVQEQSWAQWEQYYINKYGGDVGFVFVEAPDVNQGANTINQELQQLQQMQQDGLFNGHVALMGHSNGAASIFHYFAGAQQGSYKGGYPVQSFVGLDAPDTTTSDIPVATWSQWWNDEETSDIGAAAQYVQAHGIKGVYAYDQQDWLTGPMQEGNPSMDPNAPAFINPPQWTTVQSTLSTGEDHFQGAHIRLEVDPNDDPAHIEQIVDKLP